MVRDALHADEYAHIISVAGNNCLVLQRRGSEELAVRLRENKDSFVCSCCKVAVHLDRYRSLENPVLSWKCKLCEDITPPLGSPSIETVNGRGRSYVDALCVLCGVATGAFRKSTDGQWVHAFCVEGCWRQSTEGGK